MHNKKIRPVLTEILSEITAPKVIKNVECLKLFSDIMKFILTCKLMKYLYFVVFVHES